MNLPRNIKAGDEIHYVALLDEEGNTLTTFPLEQPLSIDVDQRAEDVNIDVRVNIRYALTSRTT